MLWLRGRSSIILLLTSHLSNILINLLTEGCLYSCLRLGYLALVKILMDCSSVYPKISDIFISILISVTV